MITEQEKEQILTALDLMASDRIQLRVLGGELVLRYDIGDQRVLTSIEIK